MLTQFCTSIKVSSNKHFWLSQERERKMQSEAFFILFSRVKNLEQEILQIHTP